MKYLIFIFLFLSSIFFSFPSYSSPPDLTGSWVEDIELEYSFNSKKSVYTEIERQLSKCREQKLNFDKDSHVLTVSQKKIVCMVNNKEVIFQETLFEFPYLVLASQGDAVVIDSSRSDGTGRKLVMYYFVTEDVMWTYYHGENASDQYNQRIYYRRVK